MDNNARIIERIRRSVKIDGVPLTTHDAAETIQLIEKLQKENKELKNQLAKVEAKAKKGGSVAEKKKTREETATKLRIEDRIKRCLQHFDGTYLEAIKKCSKEVEGFTTSDHFTVFSIVIRNSYSKRD